MRDREDSKRSFAEFEAAVVRLREQHSEEVRLAAADVLIATHMTHRLLREDFDKQKGELTSELEAQRMQLVADEERISSLMARAATRSKASESDHGAARTDDCALCHEYEGEARACRFRFESSRTAQIGRLQNLLKDAERLAQQAEESVARAYQVRHDGRHR